MEEYSLVRASAPKTHKTQIPTQEQKTYGKILLG